MKYDMRKGNVMNRGRKTLKRILILIMSVSPMFASAQEEYESFLEEGKVWTISERVEGVRDPYFMNWEIILSGDTIIDGIHFKHRYRRAWNWDEEKPQEWVPSGCYGQKDGKTYL